MLSLIQRVKKAKVEVDGEIVGEIARGFLVYVGISTLDTYTQADMTVNKISGLRLFDDENDKINLSLENVGGEILFISNFSLQGDCSHGFRPSFTNAMSGENAKAIYQYMCQKLQQKNINKVAFGRFGAQMSVSSVADGPFNVLYEI